MITKEQIDRINELARKSKEAELSEDEKKRAGKTQKALY